MGLFCEGPILSGTLEHRAPKKAPPGRGIPCYPLRTLPGAAQALQGPPGPPKGVGVGVTPGKPAQGR